MGFSDSWNSLSKTKKKKLQEFQKQCLVSNRAEMTGAWVLRACSTLCDPMDPTRLLCPWDVPGKDAGMGCHFLLQGTFPTWGSNFHLLHWQADSLLLSHVGSQKYRVCTDQSRVNKRKMDSETWWGLTPGWHTCLGLTGEGRWGEVGFGTDTLEVHFRKTNPTALGKEVWT